MSNVFLRLLNISITAGWIVLVVVLLRFVLKKAPKWTRVALWGLVALRLLVPVSIESALSLVPSAETVSVEPVTYEIFQVRDSNTEPVPYATAEGERIVLHSGFEALNTAVNPTAAEAALHVDTVAVIKTVAGWVWLFGAVAMLLYAAISYLRLKHKVRASVKIEKGVYICDDISDPFILGLIRPKIYLPSGMDETTKGYVLAHERAHLSRFDHIWKPLGFLLLAVYWFNPLLWLAYILLCRDIELACDEKVVKEYDAENKAAYSEALLKSSVSRRSIAACPLAFGEVGVKSRVKSILNYKKPAFWIILVALLAGIVTAVCFLTVPKKSKAVSLSYDDGPVLWFDDWDYNYNPNGPAPVTISSFPGVTFRWEKGGWGGRILAEESGTTCTLFNGEPIWNVFFTDLTGDGKPELCASVSFGSGIVDDHIVVYDYANRQSYMLWERGTFDYHLYTENGALLVGKTLCNSYSSDRSILDTGTLTMQNGLLCCQWHSDGSVTFLNRELHESELYGEWLVEEETDNDGNVLYTFDVGSTWKEYNFREDGTVTYNETVPVSSNSELAFGHPVSYPYEVHDNYVYIAGDDTTGAFHWGQYDRDTRTLTLMYSTDGGTVYAKLKRMGEGITDTPQAEAPNAVLPAETDADASLTREQADAFVNGLSVEFEDGSPYGCDLVVFIDGFGRCLNVGDADAWKTASLRFEPKEERYKPTYPHFTYAEILSVNDLDYYLDDIRISKSDDTFHKYEKWDSEHPSADASIFVYAEPSTMERNKAVPDRACVIKSFDVENRTVTVSYVSFDEPEDGYPAEILYDTVEDETFTFQVTDDTMLVLTDDYTAYVKPDRFFRYLEENRYYLDRPDSDDRGIGFWIGLDGDTLLYLCEVFEE